MGLFGNKTKLLKKEIIQFENKVRHSFSKVKEEMLSLKDWMSYYYQRSLYFENQLQNLSSVNQKMSTVLNENTDEIDKNSKLMDDFSDKLVEFQKSMDALSTKMESLNSKDQDSYKREINFHIEKIYNNLDKVDSKIEALHYLSPSIDALRKQMESHLATPHTAADIERRLNLVTEKINSLILKKTPKEKLVQKVSKNRHDYLKAVILSYIKKYEKISAFQLREMAVEEQNLTSKSTFYRILEEIEQDEGISIMRDGKEKVYVSRLKKIS